MVDGEWMVGYVVGVITRSSVYLIMKEGAVYHCLTLRRHTEREAYDTDCLDKINVDEYNYITNGGNYTQRTYVFRRQGVQNAQTYC